MSRIIVTVALLLVSGLANDAAADEGQESRLDKKAKKINAYLEKLGINDPEIVQFVATVSERVEDKKFRIHAEEFEYGKVTFSYQARPKISSRQFEIRYVPNFVDNTEVVASKRSAMINYSYKF